MIMHFGSTAANAAFLRPGGLSGSTYAKVCVNDNSSQCQYFNENLDPRPGVGVSLTAGANAASNQAHGTNDLSTPPGPSISSYSMAGAHNIPSIISGTYLAKTGSIATLYYYFMISGPENTLVPTNIIASGIAKASGAINGSGVEDYINSDSGAIATFKVGRDLDNNDTVINENLAAGYRDQGNSLGFSMDTFNINGQYDLMSNTFYEVYLSVSTNTQMYADTVLYRPPGDLIGYASIDPTFQIDPTYKDYSIQFSPGIPYGSVSPVPLPTTAPMFGAALLALGVVGYGVKRKKAAASA